MSAAGLFRYTARPVNVSNDIVFRLPNLTHISKNPPGVSPDDLQQRHSSFMHPGPSHSNQASGNNAGPSTSSPRNGQTPHRSPSSAQEEGNRSDTNMEDDVDDGAGADIEDNVSSREDRGRRIRMKHPGERDSLVRLFCRCFMSWGFRHAQTQHCLEPRSGNCS